MSSPLAILVWLYISLFTFKASKSLRMVFEVENAFHNEKTIKLKAVSSIAGRTRGESTVRHRQNLTWDLSMATHWNTVTYLCHVTEVEEDGPDTYLGYFTAYDATWLKNTHRSLPSSETIPVKWLVFEMGAITKLVPDLGGHQLVHHWLKLKFLVVSHFSEDVKLSILRGDRSTLQSRIVSPGGNLNWTQFVTGENHHFSYRCRVNRFLRRRNQALGIIDMFSSESMDRERLKEFFTLEYWWGVNESGFGNYNPYKGRFSIKKTWPLE